MSYPYVQPVSTVPIPRRLTLIQFLQTVIVGISGLDGTKVRPNWQVAPPKQPDVLEDWIAFGIDSSTPDANAFIGVNSQGAAISQRHETLSLGLSIYGPNSISVYGLIRDGFQIPSNLEALRSATMGFVDVSAALNVPDLVHEQFINRVTTSIRLRHEVQRTYPILTLISASGTIHTVLGNEQYLLDWETPNP